MSEAPISSTPISSNGSSRKSPRVAAATFAAGLSDAFEGEAAFRDFLIANLPILSRLAGVPLVTARAEQSAGGGYMDIVADTLDGRTVVFELQQGLSDTRHLGQMMHYIPRSNPDIFVWVAERFRADTVTSIEFLNERLTETRVLAAEVVLIRVGASPWAPIFHLVAGEREADARPASNASRQQINAEFWAEFANACNDRGIVMSSGESRQNRKTGVWRRGYGVEYRVALNSDHTGVGLDIGTTRNTTRAYNCEVYDELLKRKDQIDEAFGKGLNWQRAMGQRCSISTTVSGGANAPHMEAAHKTADALKRLQDIANPILEQLDWDAIVAAAESAEGDAESEADVESEAAEAG